LGVGVWHIATDEMFRWNILQNRNPQYKVIRYKYLILLVGHL
ncbi:MAG: hypothetical protein JWQ78_1234, partial [Sediminibacterium sp.]|nr:hypothetical protein [Sediminibacterium sp.]